MKKIITAALVAILLFTLSACSLTNPVEEDKGNSSSEISSASKVSSTPEEPLEDTIKELVDQNTICVKEIFIVASLPTQGAVLKDNIYQVEQAKFKDYAAFESYVRSVYCKAESDRLLNDYPNEGEPKYLNIDGKLCINMDRDNSKGYFVDWSGYTLKIDDTAEDQCEFTVTAAKTEPAEIPVKEAYPVTASAVKENGKWRLSKIFY